MKRSERIITISGTLNPQARHSTEQNISTEKPLASNFLTIIYYVVDSDGDTIIFNEKDMPGEKISNLTIKQTVSPKQGRVIIFPTNTFHTGNHPSNFPGRIVMNYNIEIRPT